MRWKNNSKPIFGDTRVINKFLLFPTRISNETRWLESVYIKQKYTTYKSWTN